MFGTWHLPGRKPVIVYSYAVLAELAAAARNQGARSMGGVLYGQFEEGETRITGFRLADCVPADDDQNPFSPAGEAQLAEWAASAPAGDGLTAVGWFRSRWHSDVQLCAEDLRVWNQYFNHLDQVALVLQVQAGGLPVRAGFFFRPQHGGPIRLGTSHRPFDVSETGASAEALTEDMGHLARAVANDPPPPASAEASFEESPSSEPELTPPSELFTLPEATGPSRGWVWAATAATALVLAGVAWLVWPRALTFPPAAMEARLRVNRGVAGGLTVSWNAGAGPVKRSQSAELMLFDGLSDKVRRVALSAGDLARGFRHFSDAFGQTVQVRMNLSEGEAVATYVGPAIAAPLTAEQQQAAEAPLRAELAQLQREIDGRSATNRELADRIATVRALLAARGVTGPAAAAAPVAAAKPPEPAATAAAIPTTAPPAAPQSAAGGEAPPQASPFGADRIPSRVTVPALPPPPPPAATYTGPASGKFIWTGYLAPGATVTVDGRRASSGSVTGGLPGVPVRLVVFPGDLASGGLTVFTSATKHQGNGATEPRSAQNGWLNTRYVYEPSRARDVQVVAGPNAAGAYKQLQIRGGDRPVTVVMVEWTVQPQ